MSMRGFTFVEIIIVIGLFTMLAALGLCVSMDTFRGGLHRSEEAMAVSLLQKARSSAMANDDQMPWGVCVQEHNYVLFRGATCAAGGVTDEEIPLQDTSTVTFSAPIIFSQLSATTSGGTITIVQGTHTDTIVVNQEGTILW
jgi:Tfp pilus assembly protein FimT